MNIIISGISLPFTEPPESAVEYAKKQLDATAESALVSKRAVDARRKNDIRFVYSVKLAVKGGGESLIKNIKNAVLAPDQTEIDIIQADKSGIKPVVAGFGPAGIFAALYLAKAGLKPVVIERGSEIGKRVKDVEKFFKTGALNPESNIQFGEGGAGTFSDGKLTTRTNDLSHAFILNEFCKHGAPKDILTAAKPHIGTDLLRETVKSIRDEIKSLGGEIRFNTRLLDIAVKNGAIASVKTSGGEIEATSLILALGHSARDTFEMLLSRGINIAPKAFSVGLRVEHLQHEIDRALYGGFAGHELLPKAEYQHSLRVNGRAVYTFCMCPGGAVVPASSEEGGVVTNGMSEYARNGLNANSAVVVSVSPDDFDDVLGGVKFQRELEAKAFSQGKGYSAPVQDIGSFLSGKSGFCEGSVKPSYLPGVSSGSFEKLFPHYIVKMLKDGILAFDRRQSGFAATDAVLTGVETRTSSPVRILRGDNYEAAGFAGVYPCGEGAGYAGGIMSAAADGIRCAEALLRRRL